MFEDYRAADRLHEIKKPEPRREFSTPMLVAGKEGTLVVKQKV